MMKRLLSLIMCLALLVPGVVLAEEDEEVSLVALYELDEEQQAMWEEWDAAAQLTEEDEEAQAEALLEELEMTNLAEIDPSELDINENLPEDWFNILLLGVDARKDVTDIGLSDVIMICSIHRETGEIKLTSIARDTAVTLPGYKNMNRINTAYKFGGMSGEKNGVKDAGPKLAMRTVNYNFDMNIEKFVTVNFFGLAAIIDSLGGVDIELTKKEATRINYELRKEPLDDVKRDPVEGVEGVHHLDGMQAVTFARIRGIDNDFVRTSRQRKLLEVLLKQVIGDMNLLTMVELMETALPYVYTNLTLEDIYELGRVVLKSDIAEKAANGEDVLRQHRIPMDKCFGYKDINGASMVWMNEKNFKLNKESIHKFIYGEVYAR
ncbi:MAG: LCP family protein [Clostridia bacterium]|nr:LCP family protein [Clostridia bacterium]